MLATVIAAGISHAEARAVDADVRMGIRSARLWRSASLARLASPTRPHATRVVRARLCKERGQQQRFAGARREHNKRVAVVRGEPIKKRRQRLLLVPAQRGTSDHGRARDSRCRLRAIASWVAGKRVQRERLRIRDVMHLRDRGVQAAFTNRMGSCHDAVALSRSTTASAGTRRKSAAIRLASAFLVTALTAPCPRRGDPFPLTTATRRADRDRNI